MIFDRHIDALTALGHKGRLAVFRLLARRGPGGVRPIEIAEALDLKQSTLSVYVTTLTRAGLLKSWREGQSVFYSLDLENTGSLLDFLANDCCRGRPDVCFPALSNNWEGTMTVKPFNVLFICTRNSARSIMAEALLNKEGMGRFKAYSAGTDPKSELNPFAIEVLTKLGHDVTELSAKHITEFQGADAPQMDFVFTVCDRAANEECEPWTGQPLSAHWGMPDPVKVDGTDAEKALAFMDTYRTLRHRMTGFVNLPISTLDRISLQKHLDAIGVSHAEQGETA